MADKRFWMSQYQMNLVLDAIDTDGMWLALLTTLPTNPDGTGLVEATGGNYGRASIAFDAAAVGAMVNTSDELVPSAESTADLGTIVGWALYDAETVGNLCAYGELMLSATLGGTTSQFDITNPSGSIFRYTWDTTGTDPGITATNPAPGDLIKINADNFAAANNVVALVIGGSTNYFDIANPEGTAENNKTIGATGSITRVYATTKACGIADQIKFADGNLVLRLNKLI